MKGDGNIKKICLKFRGLGYGNNYQAMVKVYDVDGNLLCSCLTYDGMLSLMVCENREYHVVASFLGEVINRPFYVSNNQNCYVFAFPHVILKNLRTVNFLLTDYHYDNLPIERGNIFLWQK